MYKWIVGKPEVGISTVRFANFLLIYSYQELMKIHELVTRLGEAR